MITWVKSSKSVPYVVLLCVFIGWVALMTSIFYTSSAKAQTAPTTRTANVLVVKSAQWRDSLEIVCASPSCTVAGSELSYGYELRIGDFYTRFATDPVELFKVVSVPVIGTAKLATVAEFDDPKGLTATVEFPELSGPLVAAHCTPPSFCHNAMLFERARIGDGYTTVLAVYNVGEAGGLVATIKDARGAVVGKEYLLAPTGASVSEIATKIPIGSITIDVGNFIGGEAKPFVLAFVAKNGGAPRVVVPILQSSIAVP